jgi:hypothetical protein
MPLYNPWLITLNYLRQHRSLTTAETGDDTLLGGFIQEASNEVCEAMKRVPHPYVQTRTFDYGGGFMPNVRTLNLDEDLLALTTLTNASEVIDGSGYVMLPNNAYPKWRVQLKAVSTNTFTYNTSPEQSVSVAGIWGYVPHYPACWKTLTTAAEPIDTSETAIDLTSGTLIEVGHYLLIDSEQIVVTAISSNTATVERGVNGTTAATHLTSAPVAAFQQAPDIAGAVRSIAAYYYLTKNQIGARVTVFDGGAVQVQELDPRIQKTIDRHKRRTIMGV